MSGQDQAVHEQEGCREGAHIAKYNLIRGHVMLKREIQALLNTALDQFSIPGDASFPLNQAFEAPRDRQDAETLRQ